MLVADRFDEADRACDRLGRVVLEAERQREVEHQLGVGRPLDLREELRVDRDREVSLHLREPVEEAVVHPQPAAVPERVAVRLLNRRARGGPDVREHERRGDVPGELAQVAVVPGRFDAVEDRRALLLAVPADAEAVAVGLLGPEPRVQALDDERVLPAVEELLEQDGRA